LNSQRSSNDYKDKFIEFRNVTKMFVDFCALDDVSLSIPKGCFMTLLGPSGCGKTTLMRQLAGFSEPEFGEIFLDGKKVNGLPTYKRNTPLVFQEYALFPHMTVAENICYGLKLRNMQKDDQRDKLKEMLKMFNLEGLEDRFPKQLSGGQQQRVAFARALIMGQEVLLLDEPLSNLDAKLRVDVRTELRQIQQRLGITSIYVTHDQDEALSMSDRIAVMRRGRIEQVGTPWEIYFKPVNKFVADFVGTVNFINVEVKAVEQKKIYLQWKGITFEIDEGGYQVKKGDSAILVLRPECISITPDDNGAHAANILRGKVSFYSFLGRVIRYWVEVDGNTFIIDDSNPSTAGALEGEVNIMIDSKKVHILPDEE